MVDYFRGHDEVGAVGARLSGIERDVLAVSSRGSSVREVAWELGLTEHQVREALASAMIALGAKSKLEAVLIAAQQGQIPP